MIRLRPLLIWSILVLALVWAPAGFAQTSDEAKAIQRKAVADVLGKILSVSGKKGLGAALPSLEHIVSNYDKLTNPCKNGVDLLSAMLKDSREPIPTGTSYLLYMKAITKGMDPVSINDALLSEVGSQLATRIKQKRLQQDLTRNIASLKSMCASDLWTTTYGTMLFPKGLKFKGQYHGLYPEDGGRISGVFDSKARTFTGTWSENGSAQECKTALPDTRRHWGNIVLTFNSSLTTFNGKWGYCNGALSETWTGTRK